MSDNIKVVVKVRPLIHREIEDKHTYQWRVQNNTLFQIDQNGKDVGVRYTFDKVYDKDTRTSDVYNDVAKPIVQAAIKGFNGTIFAYGQTSSGKTFTMMGTDEHPGIIPLAVLDMFETIKNIPDRDFLLRVSYIEIYNETLQDLLSCSQEKKAIKIHESHHGIKVDVEEKMASSPDEILQLMKTGQANRQTGSTNMNEQSSRSHTIFQITIESREQTDSPEEVGVNVSVLNLVDLAGSERAGQTGATGMRFVEGTHINKSLSTLASVIRQLAEDPKYRRIMWCLAVVTVLIAESYATTISDPIVATNLGLIRGQFATDGDYAMFLGIPYAQVDKSNPFGQNIAQPPFKGVFDAVDDSAMCPQREQFNNTLTGTIDCLQLNVYVPLSVNKQNSLPVMVWFHGGQFNVGSKRKLIFGPKYLVAHDVIMVAVNYRIGPYGFMCLDIPEVPGNQGLKDQKTALKWVKDNIKAFGGDVNNIAVFGESAGAISVDLQYRYNNEDTFHKVIMESGSASSSWAIQEPNYNLAINLAQQLGFVTENSLDAINFLSTANPLDVVSAGLQINPLVWPCVEKEFTGVDRFINDYAINIEIPRANTTPILLGVNSDEWLVRFTNVAESSYKNFIDYELSFIQGFGFKNDEATLVNISKLFYLGDKAPSSDTALELSQFDTDFVFIHPAKVSIVQYIQNDAIAIYNYLFKYVGKRNYSKSRTNLTLGGAVHGDEMGYLFDVSFLEEPNEQDQLQIDRMTTMWTNFVKYGDPTPTVTDLLPVKWSKVTAEKSNYLEIGDELTAKSSLFHKRMAFWDLIYLHYKTK